MAADRHRRLAAAIAATLLVGWLSASRHWTIVSGDDVAQAMAVAEPSPDVHTAASTLVEIDQNDLPPPHSVKVEAKTEHSFTLSWQAPSRLQSVQAQAGEATTMPTGYSVHCSTSTTGQLDAAAAAAAAAAATRPTSMSTSFVNDQRVVSVTSDKLEAMVGSLQPDTKYTVRVAATYAHNRSAFSLPFLVSTLSTIRPDNAINRPPATGCDCASSGTVRCAPLAHPQSQSVCVCRSGYGGRRCDACTDGHYSPDGLTCESCDCSTSTSSGSCVVNVALERGRECSGCHPGHQGADCRDCSGDYFAHGDQCLHCSCLVLCPRDKGQQHCLNCSLTTDAVTKGADTCREFSIHVRRLHQQRKVKPSDGTVAVIAVFVSLAFIATVALGLWCYRNKFHNQNQNSLWSMELHEEKISLNSSCDYQRLDAAAIGSGGSRQMQIMTSTDAETASAATTATNKDRQPSSRSAASRHADLGNHKYHCISI